MFFQIFLTVVSVFLVMGWAYKIGHDEMAFASAGTPFLWLKLMSMDAIIFILLSISLTNSAIAFLSSKIILYVMIVIGRRSYYKTTIPSRARKPILAELFLF